MALLHGPESSWAPSHKIPRAMLGLSSFPLFCNNWCVHSCTRLDHAHNRDSIANIAVSGLLGAIMGSTTPHHSYPIVLVTVSSTFNATLNIYATVFITTRLFQHRRLAIACFGPTAPTAQYLHLAGIFLESAAINVPILLVASIGHATRQLDGATYVFDIAIVCQVSLPDSSLVSIPETYGIQSPFPLC